jgi:hypothetical protein
MNIHDPQLPDPAQGRLWWAIPAACILVLMALAMVLGREDTAEKERTSYDASSDGSRAAFLVLEELGYPVVRSRRPAGGAARLVLFPKSGQKDVNVVDEWVRKGGQLILADDGSEYAAKLGIQLVARERPREAEECPAKGPDIATLAPGKKSVEWPDHPGDVWASADGDPAITVYDHGRGKIWLVNYPQLFDNRHLKKADNAILLSRLADQVLKDRGGELGFDEYVHGLRDRPGIVELLFQPPTLWITLQGLVFVGLVIWHFAPRFGEFRPEVRRRRRSKEEFLDALASLLERKGDTATAYAVVRDDVLHSLATSLGLPTATPAAEIVHTAARQRGKQIEAVLQPILTPIPGRTGRSTFVKAINELEGARERFFSKRNNK